MLLGDLAGGIVGALPRTGIDRGERLDAQQVGDDLGLLQPFAAQRHIASPAGQGPAKLNMGCVTDEEDGGCHAGIGTDM
jgi:hypothetical protein